MGDGQDGKHSSFECAPGMCTLMILQLICRGACLGYAQMFGRRRREVWRPKGSGGYNVMKVGCVIKCVVPVRLGEVGVEELARTLSSKVRFIYSATPLC
jgi:hypothetical protein